MTEQPIPTIAECAKDVINKMEAGDHSGALMAVEDLNRARDHVLYNEIGKLTRRLHDAIVNFEIETSSEELEPDGKPCSRIHDASDRLEFVITTTENAANKTMDMVEETIPIADELGNTAKSLRNDWKRLLNREMTLGEFRELYKQIDNFLEFAENKASNINGNLTSILMAQDFQDITGQVLKKVITLVHEVEDNLVDLVRTASSLQGLTSEKLKADQQEIEDHKEYLEGPCFNAEEREDVVSNQDDVDDLLSSLGF